MQERQKDRQRYFNELATTSRKYFMPYIERFMQLRPGMEVLEIGCGDGGNLLPFAEMGCRTTGVDLAECRIEDARRFFADRGASGAFIAQDLFALIEMEGRFDLIICHDVIEHIADKALFLQRLQRFLSPGGRVFISFPAWQMPFGGHQQICRGKFLSHLPFFHLLPRSCYKAILRWGKESERCVEELLEIKDTRCPIELFERCLQATTFRQLDRTLYFINPHYEVKFGLRPRRLWSICASIPYLRNYLTTSCFYIFSGNEAE